MAFTVLTQARKRTIESQHAEITLANTPSPTLLHTPQLKYLIKSVNEVWCNSQSVIHSYPQPNYSVGFKRKAFTKEQLDKIALIISDFTAEDQSLFIATSKIYFPFFLFNVSAKAL